MEAAAEQQSNVTTLPVPYDPKRLTKLAAALAKAQLEFENASKNTTAEVPFKDKEGNYKGTYKVHYADLAAVFNVVRPALARNGIAVVQLVKNDANGTVVTTRLMHESGEYLENEVWLPVALKTPQGYGSAITYARRYGLQSLVGLAAEQDDDGNASVGGAPPGGKAPPAPKQSKTGPKPTAPAGDLPEEWKEPLEQLVVRIGECQALKDIDDLMLKSQDFAKGVATVREVARKAFAAKREELAKKEGHK